MSEIERRCHLGEVRFLAPEGAATGVGTLSGYAAVFNSLSEEMGPPARRFRERLMPGAFTNTLAGGQNIFAYWNHGLAGGAMPQNTMPLGSTGDGSLRLREDAHGLAFELDLPDTSDGRDVATLIRRGTVRGVSFGWQKSRDTFHRDGTAAVRTVHEIMGLVDISPTHRPAYPETVVSVRSLDAIDDWLSMQRAMNEVGEVSFEQRQDAVRAALRRQLGEPWGPGTEYWDMVATFDSSVVVRRSGKFLSYPVAWAGLAPTLGEPADVQEVYRSGPGDTRRERTRLAEISLTTQQQDR
jgi:hypothetical protein